MTDIYYFIVHALFYKNQKKQIVTAKRILVYQSGVKIWNDSFWIKISIIADHIKKLPLKQESSSCKI